MNNNLESLLSRQPSQSMYGSKEIVTEVASKVLEGTWKMYTSNTNSNIDSLVQRFLDIHARLPVGKDDSYPAVTPAAVLRWRENDSECKGVFYLNGLVARKTTLDGTATLYLFVDNETAELWGYPDSAIKIQRS